MKLCRVLGPVVATRKHPKWHGHALMVVQPLDEKGAEQGDSYLAIDRAQSGAGDVVLVLTEGNGSRQILADPEGPIRSVIVGVVDEVYVP